MKPTFVLRQWHESDFEAFAAMNADPDVMRYFPRSLTRDESRAAFERFQQGIKDNGWGLWAVEVAGNFAGFTGLAVPKFVAHFTPCVEIGWRLRREYWGQGIAFGAASQAATYAFDVLYLEELVSFTAAGNERSRRLMERLQFQHDSRDDFNHPKLDENHPLSHHVLYRRKRKGRGLRVSENQVPALPASGDVLGGSRAWKSRDAQPTKTGASPRSGPRLSAVSA